MQAFHFVHAADLHLGAPFKGLSKKTLPPISAANSPTDTLGSLLVDASFTALSNLVKLCITQKAAFLLLSGDLLHTAQGNLRAHLALRDAFVALQKHAIHVYIARGNHDPLSSPLPVSYPDNVTTFTATQDAPEQILVQHDGKTLAHLHGMSHATHEESTNLATLFQQPSTPEAKKSIHIAMLHCTVQGNAGDHARYAPCTLTDLTSAGMDYWALGHVHTTSVLSTQPYIVYPGSLQGLHINESGAHGAMLVSVNSKGQCSHQFMELAPIEWHTVTLDLHQLTSADTSVDDADNADGQNNNESTLDYVELELQTQIEKLAATRKQHVTALLVRIVLTGRTNLNTRLRQDEHELVQRLHEWGMQRSPYIWIKDILVQTQPESDLKTLRSQQDLLGETLRVIEQWTEGLAAPDSSEAGRVTLQEDFLQPLLQHPALGKHIPPLTAQELTTLLATAENICITALEGDLCG